MNILYCDCLSGISGNMFLGALLDLGLSLNDLEVELKKLNLPKVELKLEKVFRNGIKGTFFHVNEHTQETGHRPFSEIVNLIKKSRLSYEVKRKSFCIFSKIAKAEAKIHGQKIRDVLFHEVGAIDSIVDVVGSAIGIEKLGIKKVYSSKIPLGRGFISCQHGFLPVPSPATLEILKNVPVYDGKVEQELVTPTGAAIIATLAEKFGNLPQMKILKVGYGAGSKDRKDIPNILRIVIGKEENSFLTENVYVIETNIDNMNPEIYEYLMERLFEAGALDVSFTQIQMKKNRPGTLLKVITKKENQKELIEIIFKESSTTGVRAYIAERFILPRKITEISTSLGMMPVKTARDMEGNKKSMPEYEICKKIAKEKGIPLLKVYQTILRDVNDDLI